MATITTLAERPRAATLQQDAADSWAGRTDQVKGSWTLRAGARTRPR